MPEFVIHIGPHKTGTTYLQLSFRARRAAMAARGIILPPDWEHAPGNPSHLLLAQQLRSGEIDRLAPDFARLIASGARQILLSAEDLSILDVAALESLRTLLAGNPVRFVFYVRRWCELAPSSWQESIKQGQAWTLPEFILLNVQNATQSRLMNFDHKLTRFEQVFGADSISLVGYSELRDREIDMFSHFAATFLHWPDAGAGDAPAQANASRDVATIEILRVLNGQARQRGGTPMDGLRRAFDAVTERVHLQPIIDAINLRPQKIRFNDGWPALHALHDSLLAKYHARLVPPKRAATLFRPRNKELAYADPAYLLEPGVTGILNDLYHRLAA